MKTSFKKVLIFLTVAVLCTAFSVVVFAADKTVYLSARDGDDSFNGSYSAPLKTIKAAIEALKDGGTIVVTDRYELTEYDIILTDVPRFIEPAHSGKITVTALAPEYDYRKDGACIYFSKEFGYDLSGDVRFENITFESDATTIYLTANFNAVEFGEGFDCKNTQGEAKKLFVVGGYNCPTSTDLPSDKDVNITIDSGKFSRVICFGYQKGAGTYTFTGTANVTVNNARIDRFYGGSTLNHYGGNLNLVVNGGAFSEVYLAGDATRRLLGNAYVELNDGKIVSTLYINNVMGDTEIVLDKLAVNAIKVTYGSDQLKTQAYGKKIAIKYNSIVHTADFIESVEGFTDIERFGVVYVSADGKGEGMTPDAPTSDVLSAVNMLANGGGDICIIGEYSLSNFTEPLHTRPITYSGDKLNIDGKFVAGGEIVFDNLSVSANAFLSGTSITVAENAKISGSLSLDGEKIYAFGCNLNSVSGKDVKLVKATAKNVSMLGGTLLVDSSDIENLTAKGVDGLTVYLSSGKINNCLFDGCKNTKLVAGAAVDNSAVAALSKNFDETVSDNVVYVCDGGNGSGISPDYAAGDITSAFNALANGGTVVVCGPVTVSNTYTPENGKEYKITSVYGATDFRKTNDAKIIFEGNLFLYADTEIDGVKIISGKNSTYLVFNGYKGIVGEDVLCEMEPNVTTYVSIVGGARHNNYNPYGTDLTVNGGVWYQVYGASTAATTYPDVDVKFTVNGGTFMSRVVATGAGHQTGKGVLNINGGVFYGGVYGVSALATETFNGNIEINIRGGEFYGKFNVATRYATTVNGEYTVNIGGGNFNHLTDIEGGEYFAGELKSNINAVDGFDFSKAVGGTFTYTNPIRKAADPRIALVDGMYYYMYTSSSTLSMYKAANVADLAYSVGEQIFDATKAAEALGGRIHCIWPSKLEYFPAEAFGAEYEGWYLFFSTFGRELEGLPDNATDGQSRRSYVLKCTTNDLQGDWVNPITGEKGIPEKFVSDTYDWVNNVDWCAGETALRYNGGYYTLWIEQRDRNTENFRQVMYLSKMKNPWTVTGEVLELVAPEYDWEKGGYGYAENEKKWYPAVIEGITPIIGDNNELFVLYACSGYWTTEYKLGQMTYIGGDLLSASSWQKATSPIFYKNDEVNGVGGPSICTTPDGKTRYMMYHGYLGKDTSTGRYAFMEPYYVTEKGVILGVDNHPSSLDTVFTMPLNSMPLGFKISGFDNLGTTRITLTIGKNVGHVNNVAKILDASPIIKNSRTMLPVRFVAEGFGAEVAWDGATSTATLKGNDGRIVSITIGATYASVNGEKVALDSPAYIDPASNRTYLPVRAVAEALGAKVFWNGDLGLAMLSK